MTVHREQNMKTGDQQDATILHSDHILQDSAPTTATNHIQQNQNTPNAVTGPLFS